MSKISNFSIGQFHDFIFDILPISIYFGSFLIGNHNLTNLFPQHAVCAGAVCMKEIFQEKNSGRVFMSYMWKIGMKRMGGSSGGKGNRTLTFSQIEVYDLEYAFFLFLLLLQFSYLLQKNLPLDYCSSVKYLAYHKKGKNQICLGCSVQPLALSCVDLCMHVEMYPCICIHHNARLQIQALHRYTCFHAAVGIELCMHVLCLKSIFKNSYISMFKITVCRLCFVFTIYSLN